MTISDYQYQKITSLNELIEILKLLPTEQDKVLFLCNYFEKCVSYNYEAITMGYILFGAKKMINDNFKEITDSENIYKKSFKDDNIYYFDYQGLERDTENELLDKILELNKTFNPKSIDEITAFYKKIYLMVYEKVKEKTDNEKIFEQMKSAIMQLNKLAMTIQRVYDENGNIIEHAKQFNGIFSNLLKI